MQESYTLEKFNSGRTVVGDAITELAKTDDRIWLLTPDIGWGCADFKAAYRYGNCRAVCSGSFCRSGTGRKHSVYYRYDAVYEYAGSGTGPHGSVLSESPGSYYCKLLGVDR